MSDLDDVIHVLNQNRDFLSQQTKHEKYLKYLDDDIKALSLFPNETADFYCKKLNQRHPKPLFARSFYYKNIIEPFKKKLNQHVENKRNLKDEPLPEKNQLDQSYSSRQEVIQLREPQPIVEKVNVTINPYEEMAKKASIYSRQHIHEGTTQLITNSYSLIKKKQLEKSYPKLEMLRTNWILV